jgi:PAS domain S-box-containing protein
VETWSNRAEKLYGYTCAEMIGHSIWGTIPKQCWPQHEEALWRVLSGGTPESFQTKCLTKAATVVHASIMLSPMSDLDSRTTGIGVIARDISQQVQLQEQLAVANRLTGIGTLEPGAAREINESLANVSAKLTMVIEGPSLPPTKADSPCLNDQCSSAPEIVELMQASSNPHLEKNFEPQHLRAVVGALLLELGIRDRAE